MATNGGAITAQTQSLVPMVNGARSVSSTGSKLTRVISMEGSLSIAFQLGKSFSDVITEEMNSIIQVIKTPSNVAKACSYAATNALTMSFRTIGIVITF
ncbi:unnamed protein product [Adineta ricciae]|uniref:Uncharacterized protein n=1 Tax=Adineta ricciae TaxID=249248 RepID=A0A815J0C7_ADIRI|nr:unnamed protein product [Adineta ricciae]CAF1672394.1 unnamed protein product [Adineta ricciae]